MADAQEDHPDDVPQCFLDLDLRLYQPYRNTAVVYYKLPTYAIIFIPSTGEIAILNRKHLPALNLEWFDRLKPQVMLVNAIFYPVVGYDKDLHEIRFVCCGGTAIEDQGKFWVYFLRTDPTRAIRSIEEDEMVHLAECSECSGPDHLCDEEKHWRDLLAASHKFVQLRELCADETHEQHQPEAVLRRRNQPGTEGIREREASEQQASPTKNEEQSSGPPTGEDGLSLMFLWLSRFVLVLTLAHGSIQVVLAALETLDVKLGMVEYAQLFEASMSVDSLLAVRNGEAMFVYPVALVSDIVLRIATLIANLYKGKPVGNEDIVSCAAYVSAYCVLLAVIRLRHYALSLARKRTRHESSNHNGNNDGSP